MGCSAGAAETDEATHVIVARRRFYSMVEMKANVEHIRRLQKLLRRNAQGFTVEESLNALAAVAAEAIVTLPKADRGKLLNIYGVMVLSYMRQAEEAAGPFGVQVQ